MKYTLAQWRAGKKKNTMADEQVVLDEFIQFLLQLPPLYQQLKSNFLTQELNEADNMLTSSEGICTWIIIFLSMFNSREDNISQEIVQKLQELLAGYEEIKNRYAEVFQTIQERETEIHFQCQRETNEDRQRGRPKFHVPKEQIEGLRKIGFSWTKIAQLIGISRATLYRRREELEIGYEHGYNDISDSELDGVVQGIVEQSPNCGQVMMRGALLGRGLRIQRRRIRESMLRVDPAGTECRRRLRIKRRVYRVPGPNSLWYVSIGPFHSTSSKDLLKIYPLDTVLTHFFEN
jgi:hypothetical protein